MSIGTFHKNVSRRTSMSLLFSPLSRNASDLMSSPRNDDNDTSATTTQKKVDLHDLPGVKRVTADVLDNADDDDEEDHPHVSRRFDDGNDDDDEEAITRNMKRLREQARGSSPSLSVTELMSNTKSKVDMFFSKRVLSRVMYKSEDLRQDQLVVQMITLIDRIWKSVNLDLRLTPYRVLATGPDDGLVEFIEHTSTLTDVLKDYNQDVSIKSLGTDTYGPN